jgi:hypothetical protein
MLYSVPTAFTWKYFTSKFQKYGMIKSIGFQSNPRDPHTNNLYLFFSTKKMATFAFENQESLFPDLFNATHARLERINPKVEPELDSYTPLYFKKLSPDENGISKIILSKESEGRNGPQDLDRS